MVLCSVRAMVDFNTEQFAREYSIDLQPALERLRSYLTRPDANLVEVRAFVLAHTPPAGGVPDLEVGLMAAASRALLLKSVRGWLADRSVEAFVSERHLRHEQELIVGRLTAERDVVVHERDEARSGVTALTGERDAALARISAMSAERDLAIRERGEVQESLAATQTELDGVRSQLSVLTRDRDELHGRLAVATSEQARLLQQITEKNAEIIRVYRLCDDLQAEIISMEERGFE